MNNRWIYFLIILCLLLSFAGCTAIPQEEPTDGTPPPTVDEDIFAAPPETTVPDSEDGASGESKLTLEEWQNAGPPISGLSLGFRYQTEESEAYIYSGGELNIQIYLDAQGFHEVGVGVLLFLDGQAQPYRTADSETYSYMHTFYPNSNDEPQRDVFLIPVTGQAGDTLNMQVMAVLWPDYFMDKARCSFTHTFGTTGSAAHLIYEATPPQQELPEVTDRLVSYTMEYKDLISNEIRGWTAEDLRNQHEAHCYMGNSTDGGEIYKFTADDSVEFRYEIWGNPAGSYSFVLFVDNQPVSIAPEDRIFFSNQDGQKTVITIQLDLSDFDGSSVVYGVLLGRNYLENYRTPGAGPMMAFMETNPFYLSDAADIFDLMGWEK